MREINEIIEYQKRSMKLVAKEVKVMGEHVINMSASIYILNQSPLPLLRKKVFKC